MNPDDALTWYNRAFTLNKLDKYETAIDSLKTAIEIDSQYRDMANKNPAFDNLRDNPQFQASIDSNNKHIDS